MLLANVPLVFNHSTKLDVQRSSYVLPRPNSFGLIDPHRLASGKDFLSSTVLGTRDPLEMCCILGVS